MDSAWFRNFIERCSRTRRSALPSVQEWVAAHDGAERIITGHPRTGIPAAAGAGVARQVQYSPRNDARTLATATGSGLDLGFPPGSSTVDEYNIFKDLTLHDQAAATIASASQRRSGFNANMSTEDGVAVESFKAYLNDFVAPHWLMNYYKENTVRHESSNHSQFVTDLVNIVSEGVKAVGGDAEALQKTADSIKSLAKRLSSNVSHEERLTIFSSFWMERPNPSDPVLYGIFYTTLHARYEHNGKTEIISSSTSTYSVIFQLLSGVLIQNEAVYNRLLKSSVEDWLDSHDI